MSDMMTFPATVEEFMEQYKIVDDEKVYTNGADLVPIFRMMQWFEHVSATDKNVGTTISRQQAIDAVTDELDMIDHVPQWVFDRLEKRLKQLPPAQPDIPDDARDAFMNLVYDELHSDGDNNRANRIIDAADEYVEYSLAKQSAQPEQRTGHWIPVGMAEAVGGESAQWGSAIAYHKCSECDGRALMDDFEQEVLSEWCPHCGKKMKGVSE